MSVSKRVAALLGPLAVLTPLLLAACGSDTELEFRSPDDSVAVELQARVMEGGELDGRYLDRVGVSTDTKLKLPEVFGEPIGYVTSWLGRQIPEFAKGPATLVHRIESDSELARIQAILEGDLYRPISDQVSQVDFRQDVVLAVASDCGDSGDVQPILASVALSGAGTRAVILERPGHWELIHFARHDEAPSRELLDDRMNAASALSLNCLNLFRIPASAKEPYSLEFREWFEAEELGVPYDASRHLFSLDEVYEAPPSGAVIVTGKDLTSRLLGNFGSYQLFSQIMSSTGRPATVRELIYGSRNPLLVFRASGRLHQIEFDGHAVDVIKDGDSFQLIWQWLHSDRRFTPQPPAIDFTKFQVMIGYSNANNCSSRFYKHMIDEPEQTILIELDVGVVQDYSCPAVVSLSLEMMVIPASSKKLTTLSVSSDSQGHWR